MGHARYHRPAVEPPQPRRCRDRRSPRARRRGRRGRSLAWFLPLTGLVLVWPVLFAVPGWILVRRVAPDLPAPGAVGVAIVASVFLSAHLVDVVARVVGFGRPAVLACAVILVASRPCFARIRHPWLAPLTRPTPGRRRPRPLGRLHDLARGRGRVGLVVLSSCSPTAGGPPTTAGSPAAGTGATCWSTSSIGSSILHGNFPPEVPYFAGEPLTYHWFADFHGAIASSASGVDLIPVYFADQRAVRRRPGPRDLGAGPAADRPSGGSR